MSKHREHLIITIFQRVSHKTQFYPLSSDYTVCSRHILTRIGCFFASLRYLCTKLSCYEGNLYMAAAYLGAVQMEQ